MQPPSVREKGGASSTLAALSIFASTPDMEPLPFPVKVLMGSFEEVATRAREWGYDGIELLPDPEAVPHPAQLERALRLGGTKLTVINSGRCAAQGLGLLHRDADLRRRSFAAFERLIELAGALGARVGLGGARGQADAMVDRSEADQVMEEVFGALARHAERAGTVVMLEPSESGKALHLSTVAETVVWAERIASPGLAVMLDTYQLINCERDPQEAIAASRGFADHIHLYDPSRWPPGVRDDRLDWPTVVAALRDAGFSGSGSVVVAPEGDQAEAARASARYLRELFAS